MVPFIAGALFGQWPHAVVWPAALSALGGIWLLSGGSVGAFVVGDWLTMLCAFFWSLQVFFTGRHAAASGLPVTLAVTQFAVCAAIALAFALVLEPVVWSAIAAAAPEIAYAGILAGGAAFTLQAVGQRYTTAPQAAIFLSTEALFAALFGALFLGERLTPLALSGCAFIFASILLVELVPPLMARRRLSP
jgi:drug/metabolite transporter (DMT)-like permease